MLLNNNLMNKLKNKKVFITGISGRVGSHLAEFLFKKTNCKIYGLIRWRSNLDNLNNLIPDINRSKRIFLNYGDLNDDMSLDKIIKNVKPDYIYHLAAQSYPQTSFTEPVSTLSTNILGTLRVLEAAKKYSPNAHIHVCSSSEVFGRVDKSKLPINEECSFHPASPYAISKVGTDLIGKFYFEAYGLKIQITRMFTHTGPRRGDVFAESTFAKQIAMIEQGYIEPVIKVGNLNSLRTVADVRDAVEAYFLLLTKKPIPGSIYNIGGKNTFTVKEILDFLISKSTFKNKIKIKIEKKRLRPIDADLQIPDVKKFIKHTKWKPKISFDKTMMDLLNYWRKRVKEEGNIFLQR